MCTIPELHDYHPFECDPERVEFMDSLLANNKHYLAVAECMEAAVRSPNPTLRELKAANE